MTKRRENRREIELGEGLWKGKWRRHKEDDEHKGKRNQIVTNFHSKKMPSSLYKSPFIDYEEEE